MEDMAQPTQTDPQFKLRLPADLKDRVQRAAEHNNRSMNAEIVATLEEKYPAPHDRSVFDLIDELREKMESANDPDTYETVKRTLHAYIDSMEKMPLGSEGSTKGFRPDYIMRDTETGEEFPVEVKQVSGRTKYFIGAPLSDERPIGFTPHYMLRDPEPGKEIPIEIREDIGSEFRPDHKSNRTDPPTPTKRKRRNPG